MQRGCERTATSLLNHSRSFSISGLAICIQGVASCIIGGSLCCVQHLGVPCTSCIHPGIGTKCMLHRIQRLLSHDIMCKLLHRRQERTDMRAMPLCCFTTSGSVSVRAARVV